MIYLELFWSFFQIGLFSIGGGYAALPMIRQQIVETHGWLSMTAFTDVITIAEMTPGPIAINAATFVGTQLAGLPGAVLATLGCVTPSCIIWRGCIPVTASCGWCGACFPDCARQWSD